MLARFRGADLISIYSSKSFSGFPDMSWLSTWFTMKVGTLTLLSYQLFRSLISVSDHSMVVLMMFYYYWAVYLGVFRAGVVIFQSAFVGWAQFWPAPGGSTGQPFLILVLLITLTFRSSDYITILFGSGAELFLPESLRRFSLGRVMAKLDNTSETSIAITFLVMNLSALLRQAFWLFFCLFHNKNFFWFFLALIIGKSYVLPKHNLQNLYCPRELEFTHLSKCCFLTFSASPTYDSRIEVSPTPNDRV